MRQLPDKPLASRGRLPSDIDGDEARVKCDCCGRRVWESQIVVHWLKGRSKSHCPECSGQ